MHHACPHHAQVLIRHSVHGLETWRCEQCEGLWVPGAIVRKLAMKPHWPAAGEMRTTTLRCPDDGRLLSALLARGVELDCCTQCHGVWLDHGEIDTIPAKDRQPTHAADLAGAVPDIGSLDQAADLAGDAVTAVFEFIGEIFSAI